MTTKIRISEVAFVDLVTRTPKSLIDKAVATTRQQHAGAGISVDYISEIDGDKPTQSRCVEISKTLFTKRTDTEGWRKRAREAIVAVRNAKQTFHRELKRLQELAEMLKDVYGLDPIEGGD